MFELCLIFRGKYMYSTFELGVHSTPVTTYTCTCDDLCRRLESVFHDNFGMNVEWLEVPNLEEIQ